MTNTLKNSNLIPWQKVREKIFTEKERNRLDLRANLAISLRKLKEERKKRGLTQQELARQSGIPRTTITKIESGYHNASLIKIMQIAEAMNLGIEVQFIPLTGRS